MPLNQLRKGSLKKSSFINFFIRVGRSPVSELKPSSSALHEMWREKTKVLSPVIIQTVLVVFMADM